MDQEKGISIASKSISPAKKDITSSIKYHVRWKSYQSIYNQIRNWRVGIRMSIRINNLSPFYWIFYVFNFSSDGAIFFLILFPVNLRVKVCPLSKVDFETIVCGARDYFKHFELLQFLPRRLSFKVTFQVLTFQAPRKFLSFATRGLLKALIFTSVTDLSLSHVNTSFNTYRTLVIL